MARLLEMNFIWRWLRLLLGIEPDEGVALVALTDAVFRSRIDGEISQTSVSSGQRFAFKQRLRGGDRRASTDSDRCVLEGQNLFRRWSRCGSF